VGQLVGGASRLLRGRKISPILLIGGLFFLCICAVLAIWLLRSGGLGDLGALDPGAGPAYPTSTPLPLVADRPTATTAPSLPTSTPRPVLPPASGEGQTWLVMLYQDADDKILEQDIYVDLNEVEKVGSTDRVHVVAQVDRYRGGYRGDGDWTGTKRFYVTQDHDLNRVGSQMVQDLGEVNMADGATLVDFATWAIGAYPADKYVLIMSDHGMGWPGGWSDPDPKGPSDPNIPLSRALGDELYLMEIDQALADIRAQTGIEAFELVGMDACLMGHIEVFAALAPHARYAVASQETEPAVGWAYTSFMGQLAANPDVDGAVLGQWIVDSYISEDQRIVDDQARAELLRRAGARLPTAAQVAQHMERNTTLSAVDLSAMPGLMESVNRLAFVLQGENQKTVARARNYAQSYTSIFGSRVPPSYIDLGNFCQFLKQGGVRSDAAQAIDQVWASLSSVVIAERHGSEKSGSTGISIYFPNSQLYRSPAAGEPSYSIVSQRFARSSLWDDFLSFHYTGRAFESTVSELVVPAPDDVRGPGAGVLQLGNLQFSDQTAAPGRPVLISADIDATNLGHVYLYVGFYDAEANSILVADTDYLESAETREIEGVYYPDWGEGGFTMEFEWEPIVFAISDGTNTELALFKPESYGAVWEEAIYSVEGTYTYADGGETRAARLYFQNGELQQVFGFTGAGASGAPREILPSVGDQFTIQQQWMDLNAQGQLVQTTVQEGGTLIFGEQSLTWVDQDAPVGTYMVGFVIEDLDGNRKHAFGKMQVE
jgi:hypothetical protein